MPFFLFDIIDRAKGSFIKEKSSATFFLLLSLSLILFLFPVSFKNSLSEVVIRFTYGPFNSLAVHVGQLYDVHRKNKILNEKVTSLTLENTKLQEESRENQRLRQLLGFKSASSYQIIPAEVVSVEPERFSTSILINLGEKDGVKKNMPVINLEGLVGKVSEVLTGSSVVQLLYHPNCRVPAVDSRNRVQGIVKSKGGINLNLDNVPTEEDVKSGDEIYSSGMGKVFPEGLKIGQVLRVYPAGDSVFKTIILKPAVDFSRLEEIFLIKNLKQD
ncbi:MAG TPA: rod shape-determining protein MreC [Terriglobales bacterium]|nr:rod shape-determining protein MreC [Terriglobales bacterium]